MISLDIIYITLLILVVLILIMLRFAYNKSLLLQTPMPKQPLPCQPDDFHLAYENVMFNAADGTVIKGWFIPSLNEYSTDTIILCHGRGSNKGNMLQKTHFLAERYNLLYIDMRACGESGGNTSTIGYMETRDFDAACKFLKDNRDGYAERIAVFGSSVGGSVAIYGAAKYPEIAGVVADSVFLSLENVVRNWCRSKARFFLPLVPLILHFSRRRLKTDPEAYSPLMNIAKMKCPILFIHGDNDGLIPREDRETLFNKCGSSKKEEFIISGATHTKCAETGGELYRNKIALFLSEILPEKTSVAGNDEPDKGVSDGKKGKKQKKGKK